MKKRNYFVFAIAAALGITMAGCGNNSSVQPQDGVAPSYEGQGAAQSTQAPADQTEGQGESQAPAGQTEAQGEGQAGQQAAGGITEEEARSIALADAGLTEAEVSAIRAKQDWEDGILVYEVEFYAGAREYDYEIEAATGVIVSMDYDVEEGYLGQGSQPGETISQEQAVQLVTGEIPGIGAEDIRIKLDYDDGRPYYEGEAYYENREYEFEINAATGEIVEWSEEIWR